MYGCTGHVDYLNDSARHDAPRIACVIASPRLGAMSEKIPPGMPGAPQKLGFNTYFMWGLCVVVVGVCYYMEEQDKKKNPYIGSSIPEEVARVLPSGAWLMKDGSIKKPTQ